MYDRTKTLVLWLHSLSFFVISVAVVDSHHNNSSYPQQSIYSSFDMGHRISGALKKGHISMPQDSYDQPVHQHGKLCICLKHETGPQMMKYKFCTFIIYKQIVLIYNESIFIILMLTGQRQNIVKI